MPLLSKGDIKASTIPKTNAINPTLVYTSINADF